MSCSRKPRGELHSLLRSAQLCESLIQPHTPPRRFRHAFFVVELLNSLLRDSTIAYSPRRYRYAWDQGIVDLIQTCESVAELIASNISSLPLASQIALRILSCFGIQVDLPLLQIVEQSEEGIISHVDEFIELGVLDRAGPIVIFAVSFNTHC